MATITRYYTLDNNPFINGYKGDSLMRARVTSGVYGAAQQLGLDGPVPVAAFPSFGKLELTAFYAGRAIGYIVDSAITVIDSVLQIVNIFAKTMEFGVIKAESLVRNCALIDTKSSDLFTGVSLSAATEFLRRKFTVSAASRVLGDVLVGIDLKYRHFLGLA